MSANIVLHWLLSSFVFWALLEWIHVGVEEEASGKKYPEMVALVSEYFRPFKQSFTKHEFDKVVKHASKLKVSRGATAIVQIINHKVYVDMTAFTSPHAWDHLRLQFILARIKHFAHLFRDMEMIVNVQDCPLREDSGLEVPVFTMTKCKGREAIPLPQWFRERDGRWDLFGLTVAGDKPAGISADKIQKKPKAVFRGTFRQSIFQHKDGRLRFTNITKDNWFRYGRSKLLEIASRRPDIMDVGVYTNNSEEYRLIASVVNGTVNAPNKLSMREQADMYKYTVNVEGACGWADRLKTQLQYKMIVLKQDAPCDEFFAPLMREYVHYVPVDNEMLDLEHAIDHLNSDGELRNFISLSVDHFQARYLTKDAWEQYVYEVLLKYQSLASYKVHIRPGAKLFKKESRCDPRHHDYCDDSASYESCF